MKDFNQFLKKQSKVTGHHHNNLWTISNIEAGFEKFFEEYERYPSSTEIDTFEYLPSSRQIQRMFGGLQSLRKKMSLEHEAPDHNKGIIRSKIAGDSMVRAANYEEDYYKYLINLIPELYIHEHKVIRFNDCKTSADFFIYPPDSNKGFVIDLFYAMDIINLMKQVKIKEPKYNPMPYRIFFVSMNNEISQGSIDIKVSNKVTELPENIEVYNVDHFNFNILPKIVTLFKKNKHGY